ncbi:replication initiation protein [Thiocapsa roseopersicina]|uniref:Initiator Replication protein n=1 Tax=Thiocapsa roseopersicina TaxID=1058 RepID=A0A1H3DAI3_THIRO|nr:replication initiation protein [Thiocapsa roseopersicina]SDX62689.1 Initiator Replication protein [Thiocapsa roseopersicina]
MPNENTEGQESVPNTLSELSENGEPILKKYVGAVHIGADLTLYQRRAFNVLLFWAMPHMLRTTRHEINVNDLAWGMGLDRATQRMSRLIENLEKMMAARVVWNLLDEKGDLEEWESTTLLPYVKFNRRTQIVTYEFTRAFQERVYSPTEFAEIALRMQRAFRSEHALALYENARRFLPQGETPWIPIETFRKLMGVDKKTYYDEFKYLNSRLIKPSIKQVNECSDIRVQMKTKRSNRAVIELKFLVEPNPQMTLFAETLSRQDVGLIMAEGQKRLILRLSGYRITGKRAAGLIDQYSEDDIIAALDAADAWMEAKEKRRESIANPAGVVYKAITEGWRMSIETSQADSDDVPDTTCSTRSERQESAERARERMASEFRRRWYADYVKGRSREELEALEQTFRESLQAQGDTQMILERMDKQGITGIVLGVFQHHLASLGIAPTKDEVERHLDNLKQGDGAA